MSQWSLSQLLSSLHEDIQQRLSVVRKTFGHPGTKGDASENVWIDMLDTYLPKRYQAAKAHVVDSLGNFSQQIDVVVSSMGNAKSLKGGTLITTPLRGADGEIYALAQGNMVVGGAGASAGGSKVKTTPKWRFTA